MEIGNLCKIEGIDYIVLANYENYLMLLNASASEINGSGNIIIVEDFDGKTAKVVKDKVKIAYVVNKVLKSEEDK